MSSTLFRTIGGHCDYLDAEHKIKVHVKKTHPIGQPHPVHNPTGFECSHSNKCPNSNECPIWKKARKMII